MHRIRSVTADFNDAIAMSRTHEREALIEADLIRASLKVNMTETAVRSLFFVILGSSFPAFGW